MSKGEVSTVHNAPAAAASSQYLHWLRRERRTRLIIRAAQVAILAVIGSILGIVIGVTSVISVAAIDRKERLASYKVPGQFAQQELDWLLGIGGIGKTRTALRYARGWMGDHPGGAWFCDLAAARSEDGIVQATAQALGVSPGPVDPVERLGQAMAGRGACLVIFDNFEQVTRHAEATLGRWLAAAPQAQFLVTSREVLGIEGSEALVQRSRENAARNGLSATTRFEARNLFELPAPGDRNFTSAYPGAVPRSVEDKFSETLSARDFGSPGNGTSDDGPALQAAMNAAAASGKHLIIGGEGLAVAFTKED